MGYRRLFSAALATSLACIGQGQAETTIIRPGSCAAQTTYLLAGNSGALILVEPTMPAPQSDHVIVFRYQPTRGWASQRLLRRFDLQLEDGGPRVVNSGAFCRGVS